MRLAPLVLLLAALSPAARADLDDDELDAEELSDVPDDEPDDFAVDPKAVICPEGAATLAAVRQLREDGWLGGDEEVVVLNTGAGIKYAPPELPTPIDLTGGSDEVHGQVIAALSAA